jgi:hypothetical protein
MYVLRSVFGAAIITSNCPCMFFMSSIKYSVCPAYFNWQSMHFIWYIPLFFSYLSVCECGFIMFHIFPLVLNAANMYKSTIYLPLAEMRTIL